MKILNKLLKNDCSKPILYWFYQQSPRPIRKIVWWYDDVKFSVKTHLQDMFCWYPEWVEGRIVAKDETGVWLGWSDDDTFIPASNKKWCKLFNDINEGDTFRCHFYWGYYKDNIVRIKDVELVKRYEKTSNEQDDLSWLKEETK